MQRPKTLLAYRRGYYASEPNAARRCCINVNASLGTLHQGRVNEDSLALGAQNSKSRRVEDV